MTDRDRSRFPDIKSEFDEAIRLRDAGQLDAARDMLVALTTRSPHAAFVFGVLGGVQRQLGHLVDAVESFRKATELAPKSDLGSRGLFHSLYNLGLLSEAFTEMARFRTTNVSPEYDRLLLDLQDEVSLKSRKQPDDALSRSLRKLVDDELAARPVVRH